MDRIFLIIIVVSVVVLTAALAVGVPPVIP